MTQIKRALLPFVPRLNPHTINPPPLFGNVVGNLSNNYELLQLNLWL